MNLILTKKELVRKARADGKPGRIFRMDAGQGDDQFSRRCVNQAPLSLGNLFNSLTLVNTHPFQKLSFYGVSWGQPLEKTRTEPQALLRQQDKACCSVSYPVTVLHNCSSLGQPVTNVWLRNQILQIPTSEDSFPSKVIPLVNLYSYSNLSYRIGYLSEHPQFITSSIKHNGRVKKKNHTKCLL